MWDEKITFAAIVAASWHINLVVTQILPHFQNSLVNLHAVCLHCQGFHIIRWCSSTCCIIPNIIILTNKYIISLTSWVLKTYVWPPSRLSMDILREEDQILKKLKSKSTSELQISLLQQVIWWRNEGATSDQISCHFSGPSFDGFGVWNVLPNEEEGVPNLHTGHVILGSSDILICPNCVVSDQTLITFPFWVPGYETKWEGIPKERFETTNGGDYRIATVFRQISVDVKYATG